MLVEAKMQKMLYAADCSCALGYDDVVALRADDIANFTRCDEPQGHCSKARSVRCMERFTT